MDALDLSYYVGDTAPIKVTVTDSESGGAFDLTGCKAVLSVKAAATDSDEDAAWRYTTSDQIAITSAAGGIMLISPILADSEALTPNTDYFADLVITDASGRYLTATSGKFHALRRITGTPAS